MWVPAFSHTHGSLKNHPIRTVVVLYEKSGNLDPLRPTHILVSVPRPFWGLLVLYASNLRLGVLKLQSHDSIWLAEQGLTSSSSSHTTSSYSFVPYSVMNYPYSIPSVTQIHPDLANDPNVVNVQAFQGVHTSNLIGTPINPLAVIDAEGTVEFLLGAKSECGFPSTSPQDHN
jgi:hypothetical protein